MTNACLKEFAMDLEEVWKTTFREIDEVIFKTKKKKKKGKHKTGKEIFANDFLEYHQ